jgi:hypothetical protein
VEVEGQLDDRKLNPWFYAFGGTLKISGVLSTPVNALRVKVLRKFPHPQLRVPVGVVVRAPVYLRLEKGGPT